MISETGVWSEEEQRAHIFSYNVARFVASLIKTDPIDRMIYDIGCGNGKYLQYFADVTILAWGFDGFCPKNLYSNINQHDLTTPLKLESCANILCLEVWEHIPPQYEDIFVDNLVNNLKGYLILSVAVEGQEGLGHVNCRSNEYVINKLQERGLTYLPELTEQIRKEPEPYVSYFKNTLMIFQK
jgi:2-polyprenyl-3-methyl-5-hydroxy-6-metoxy-1,4-benzoquinol methylase